MTTTTGEVGTDTVVESAPQPTQAVSLRSRLEAKQPRRQSLPVLVGDPAQHQATIDALSTQLRVLTARPDALSHLDIPAEEKRISDELAAVQERMRAECFVEVPFRALPAAEYEVLLQRHQTSDDADGIDLAAFLPDLAAASCDDESLQDPQWWSEQFSSAGWSAGDTIQLRHHLMSLNTLAPAAHLGKG